MKVIGLTRPAPLVAALWVSLALALFTLFLLLAIPAHAQEVTPTVDVTVESPTPEATEAPPLIIDQPLDEPIAQPPSDTAPVFTPPSPIEVLNGVILAFLSYFVMQAASPLTAAVVSLLKRVPWVGDVDTDGNPRFSGQQLNFGVAILLSVVTWGAAALGLAGQLDTVFSLILVALPVLTGAGGNFIGNRKVFNWGVKNNVPVLSYTRSEPEASTQAVGTTIVLNIPVGQPVTPDLIAQAMANALNQRPGSV